MARATISLPQPVSPVISTDTSVRATRRALSRTWSMAWLTITAGIPRKQSGVLRPHHTYRRTRPVSRYLSRDPENADREAGTKRDRRDRKSTRLNSSHLVISYAVFC